MHVCSKCKTQFITPEAREACNHGFAEMYQKDNPRFMLDNIAAMPERVVVDRPTPWLWEFWEIGLAPPSWLPNFKSRIQRLSDALRPHGGLQSVAVDPCDGLLIARSGDLLFAHEATL